PPRCAVVTFDDGWKSQYEVAWPIMKKFEYPFTMFIYTEGVRGGSLGGGEAITWEQLADMRDNGIDIEAHTATHQDLREGHNIMLASPGGKKTRTKLTGPQYEQWVQNEVVGSKQLLEQRLGIKVNCFAVPFGNYNEHVKELAREIVPRICQRQSRRTERRSALYIRTRRRRDRRDNVATANTKKISPVFARASRAHDCPLAVALLSHVSTT